MRTTKFLLIVTAVMMGAIALTMTSCGDSAVKIEGDTITLNDISKSVKMDKFAIVTLGEEYDEWTVDVTCNPEATSAALLDMSIGGFVITPVANVHGSGIVVTGVNGTGTDFTFTMPKGTTPASYKIKIENYILTYDYATKIWSYSTDDKGFKPAEKIKL